MAKRKKRSSAGRFVLGMLVYALAFLSVVAVGLRVFWNYIDRYEQAQPTHAVDSYTASFDESHIRSLAAPFVATLDHELQSEDEAYAVINEQFASGIRCVKDAAESTEDHLKFVVVSNGKAMGSMTMDKTTYENGDIQWRVTDESFDFSYLLSSNSITVPSDWQVSVGDKVLDASFVTESNIKYEAFADLYDEGLPLPYLQTYTISNYIGEKSFTVKDWNGEVTEVPADIQTVAMTDRCTPQERERMTEFCGRFLPLYIAFMSNSNHDIYTNYAQLSPYLLQGSDIAGRIYNAMEGQTYSHSKGDVLHDIVYNSVLSLGNNTYLIDIDYQVDTTGNAGTVTASAGVYVVAVDLPGEGRFVTSMYVK